MNEPLQRHQPAFKVAKPSSKLPLRRGGRRSGLACYRQGVGVNINPAAFALWCQRVLDEAPKCNTALAEFQLIQLVCVFHQGGRDNAGHLVRRCIELIFASRESRQEPNGATFGGRQVT